MDRTKKNQTGQALETRAVQACHHVDAVTRAPVPALQLSTTFLRGEGYAYPPVEQYQRGHHYNSGEVEALLQELEAGEEALVFASGMSAACAVVTALKPGDHVIAHEVIYWAFRAWLVEFCADWGITLELVDLTDLEKLRAALRPGDTRLVWGETPSNPLWQVLDIEGLAQLAHGAGALLAIDSTCATPVHTRPIELGADIVMHSATKYLNGHSDLLAGALIFARKDDFAARVKRLRGAHGSQLAPFECWMLQRGLRTLYVRVRQQSASALRIARHFEGHPAVEAVRYPGLESHPQHELAVRQMQGGFGGMLSLQVKGGKEASLAALSRMKVFMPATSLGGVESLVEHRWTIEGEHEDSPVPQNLLRISVGIEDCDDLIADLEQALLGD